MSTATAIDVRELEPDTAESGRVEGLEAADDRQRYERLTARMLQSTAALASPQPGLPIEEWEEHFLAHQQALAELKRLGDRLRPVILRERGEPLSEDALIGEVMELFAA